MGEIFPTLIAIVITIVPIAFLVPAAFVLVPPAVVLIPAALAGLVQFGALVFGLPAMAAVALNGFVQFMVRMLDPTLTAIVAFRI